LDHVPFMFATLPATKKQSLKLHHNFTDIVYVYIHIYSYWMICCYVYGQDKLIL